MRRDSRRSTPGSLHHGRRRLALRAPRPLRRARIPRWEFALALQECRYAQMIARRTLHRVAFIVAGIYNMAWGMWSIADPQWLFRVAGMPLANQPAVFACLGMVVGLYGILYLEV